MIGITIMSQFLLYASLASLMGTFILQVVPEKFRPQFSISNKWLIICAAMIPFAAFVPNIQLITIILPQFGFVDGLSTILLKYKVGHSWLAIVALTLVLVIMIRIMETNDKKILPIISSIVLTAIMAAMAYISHASSMIDMTGAVYDFIHLFSVSIWLGILIIISFFSTSKDNWEEFLKWFSPTALVCFTAVALSGVLMTEAIVPSYVTGWASVYGQGLFIKHILLLPLTFIILGNALLIKLKMQKPLFDPRTWVKIEVGLLIGILFFTAVFSEQQPPMFAVEAQDISAFFQLFYNGTLEAGMTAYFQITGMGIIFFLLTAVFIGLLVVSYIKETPIVVSISMAFAMALCFYMGFISIVFFS